MNTRFFKPSESFDSMSVQNSKVELKQDSMVKIEDNCDPVSFSAPSHVSAVRNNTPETKLVKQTKICRIM